MNNKTQPTDTPACQSRLLEHLIFVALSLACMWFVFGGAMTGKSILAPLDLAVKMASPYSGLEAQSNSIPQNHYVADILSHELPRQYSIYKALNRGEFPWWDPYTDGGRPLIAEAHASGSDPLRMGLYLAFPFVTAYNASKLIESFLFALGAYLLFRHRNYPGWICIAGAVTYQFATSHALFETPLSVDSSFAYYALLWWAWERYLDSARRLWLGLAALLCACIIMAGNQQSHVYLALFGLCFVAGYGFKNRALWKRLGVAVVGGAALGALIALPVLIPQFEVFLLCHREMLPSTGLSMYLTGGANISAIFPWMLGTFRTLDLSKVVQQSQIGFCIYFGSAGFILALAGAFIYSRSKQSDAFLRTAVILCLAYFFICSTPLVRSLYLRCSNLAVLGLIILAAYALNQINAKGITPGTRTFVRVLGCLGLGVFVAVNVIALFVYPRFEDRIEKKVLAMEGNKSAAVSQLRQFQVHNFAKEVSFRNPETVLAALGIAGILILVGFEKKRPDPRWMTITLAASLAPSLLFSERFISKEPIHVWREFLAGNPAQQSVKNQLKGGLRLSDEVGCYIGALPLLFEVHSLTGYSSFTLIPVTDALSELHLSKTDAIQTTNGLQMLAKDSRHSCRFQWLDGLDRPVDIVEETLNHITLEVAPGAPGKLVRTDRNYPGWKLKTPGTTETIAGLLAVKVPAEQTRITFEYKPRLVAFSIPVSVATLAGCLLLLLSGLKQRPQTSPTP